MNEHGHDRPRLRMVGADDDSATGRWQQHDAQRAVARENRAAARADLDPTDPRWLVAVTTSRHLEGAVLSPERRTLVLRRARQLGVQPFEANMIIALVQEQARRGGTIGDARSTLGMIDLPQPDRSMPPWLVMAFALAFAAVGAVALIRWLLAQ